MIERGRGLGADIQSAAFPASLRRFRELEAFAFGSQSERACGITLEAFLNGWKILPGKTFQVAIGGNRHVDYVLPDGAILEWHPPDLRSGFRDREAGREFLSLLRHIDRHTAERMIAAQKKELTAVYTALRRKDIDLLPENRGRELIVVTNFAELYAMVIRRYCPQPPGYVEARKIFTESFPRRPSSYSG